MCQLWNLISLKHCEHKKTGMSTGAENHPKNIYLYFC